MTDSEPGLFLSVLCAQANQHKSFEWGTIALRLKAEATCPSCSDWLVLKAAVKPL